MYRTYEERNKIKELQKYLFITESGNYDEKTREAVLKIQSEYDLTENGEVDYDTFSAIYAEYRLKSDTESYKHMNFPIKIDTYSDAMWDINKILLSLSSQYGIQTNLRHSDYYGERSERVLEDLDAIHNLDRRPMEIDVNTYIRLKKDFDSITLD